jgi:hypothetical protein
MPFTNIWDDTFPADTELANLIGANLRQLRLDIQQRMGAISGLSTSMPAFGSDAQPTNWTGLLYFATDTGHIFQWSGSAWVDVTTDFLGSTTPLNFSTAGGLIFNTNTTLVQANLGNWGQFAAANVVVTLPALSGTTKGQTFTIIPSGYSGVVQCAGADTIVGYGGISGTSISIFADESVIIASNGSAWYVVHDGWAPLALTPNRVTLSSAVSLSTSTLTTILSTSVTFPTRPGKYRADVRYSMWCVVNSNVVAACVQDTTNSFQFAACERNSQGAGYECLAASEISNNVYNAGATATFVLSAICNFGGQSVEPGSTTYFGTNFSGAPTFLSVTPVLAG